MPNVDIEPDALRAGLLAKRRPDIARALNLAEDRRPMARAALLQLLDGLPTHAHRVGITGPPGVGKSTLTAALTRELRTREHSVGVVAVDPSSIQSRGSLLGDRARMGFDPEDPKTFVRSMATHGVHGGISAATPAAIAVLAAAFDVVLVETTGVGQTEVEVRHAVDTTVMVVQPGSGDTLQFIKAGIMEVPDIFVVNKADQGETASRALADLETAMHAQQHAVGRAPLPCLKASALENTGFAELADALDAQGIKVTDESRRTRATEMALALFVREHGAHGVRTLGGTEQVRTRARSHPDVWAALDALSREYLGVG